MIASATHAGTERWTPNLVAQLLDEGSLDSSQALADSKNDFLRSHAIEHS